MKKIKKILCFATVFMPLSLLGIGMGQEASAIQAVAQGSWMAEYGVVAEQEDGLLLTMNEANIEATFTSSQTYDFKSGTQVDFTFPEGKFYARESQKIPSGMTSDEFRPEEIKEIRGEDNDYVTFTVATAEGQSIELKARALFADDDPLYNKMLVDVTYLDGMDKEYVESFETYRAVFGDSHTFAIREQGGYYYASFDGIAAIPVASYCDMDLSEATLSIKLRSRVVGEMQLVEIKEAEQSFVYGDWSTFGATEITEQQDGTVSFKAEDMRVKQYNGTKELRIRESVINVKGYDVHYPIVLEGCYDINETMAVWWGFGLGRTPFDTAEKLIYNEDNTVKTEYSSNILVQNDGIMFQTTTGIAQQQVKNSRVCEYFTNAGTRGYNGYENLDRIVIEIGETSTKLTYNGELLFDDMTSKQSDFKDGKVYPFFHFIGTPANPYKQNRVIIKGVNQPLLTIGEIPEVKLNAPSMLSVSVDNYGNRNGVLEVYKDKALTQPFEASGCNYDDVNKLLTISAVQFNGYAVGLHQIYLKNDEGVSVQTIRVRDASATYLPAEIPEGLSTDGNGDLSFTVDLKGNTFVRIAGNGLSSSGYTAEADGNTLSVTIKREFLSKKAAGEYVFRVITITPEQDELESAFTLTVVNGQGENEESSGGCGSNVEWIGCSAIGAALMFIAVKKRRRNIS